MALPCHRFWSQLVYDDALHRQLESALQALPRPHDLRMRRPERHPRAAALVDDVARGLFLVFLRLSTHRESPEDFFTQAAHGQIIYDNYLLDVPRLLDLCALFRGCAPR